MVEGGGRLVAVSVTFTAPNLEELLEQIDGFTRTARARGIAPRSDAMPLADPPPPQPGRACPTHLKELVLKHPGPNATWPAGYYCPERGCRVYHPAPTT